MAIALNLYPELGRLIGEIVTMGGGIEAGNVTPYAEFNFFADPRIDSVRHRQRDPPEHPHLGRHADGRPYRRGACRRRIRRERLRAAFLELQQLPLSFFEKRRGIRATMLPDPLTAAYLVDRGIARRTVKSGLRMELDRGERRGASVLSQGRESNIVLDVDKARFMAVLSRIKGLRP